LVTSRFIYAVIVFLHFAVVQRFDTVGWMTGRHPSCKKSRSRYTQRFFFGRIIGDKPRV